MSGTHSILAPSGMSITMQCAAAPRMQLPYADAPPTEESLEGDAAHWLAHAVAAWYIAGNPEAELPGKGDKAPNGVAVTQEMIDGAELWAETIGAAPGREINLESRVLVQGIHKAMYGTPDADGPDDEGVYDVFDYKFGHRWVDPFELWQCLAYLRGIVETRLGGMCPERLRITVVQPRAYGPGGKVRSWELTAPQLYQYTAQMHARAYEAVAENGVPHANVPATTGPECGDCKGRHACTALQAVAAKIVDQSARADVMELEPKELGAELSYLTACIDRLKARTRGLEIQAEVMLGRGERIPGWGMESTVGNLAWLDSVDVDEVAGVGAVLNVALCKDVELVTPTQAKTILKRRGLDVELLDSYSSRPHGKMKLVQQTTDKARKAFGAKSK